ncbi:MAG: XDD4 family exosortase-dependent surface protein [Planctomycetota bacterium]
MKKLLFVTVILLCGVSAANATIILSASGISAKGVDVTFEAQLTISGDILTVILINDSPVDSLNPDDVLGSFYFDILDGDGMRPVLAYNSATGDTYKGVKNGPDILLETGADLQAFVSGDDSWQFKTFDEAFSPFLGFGIGTVGNSGLFPNGFDGNIVDGVDFAIYTGEITTQPLVNPDYLVKDTATFTFTGLTGFTEADILPEFAFGLGTAPDSLLTPEPATMVLLGLGGLVLRRKR